MRDDKKRPEVPEIGPRADDELSQYGDEQDAPVRRRRPAKASSGKKPAKKKGAAKKKKKKHVQPVKTGADEKLAEKIKDMRTIYNEEIRFAIKSRTNKEVDNV